MCANLNLINTEKPEHEFDIIKLLQKQRLQNPKKIIIGHLNINSLRNKIDFVKDIFKNNIDILLISETKLDPSFPLNQFSINGFKFFRKDRDRNGGGLILYINEDIACKAVNIDTMSSEYIAIELMLKNKKWLLIGLYNPPVMHHFVIPAPLCNTCPTL